MKIYREYNKELMQEEIVVVITKMVEDKQRAFSFKFKEFNKGELIYFLESLEKFNEDA